MLKKTNLDVKKTNLDVKAMLKNHVKNFPRARRNQIIEFVKKNHDSNFESCFTKKFL